VTTWQFNGLRQAARPHAWALRIDEQFDPRIEIPEAIVVHEGSGLWRQTRSLRTAERWKQSKTNQRLKTVTNAQRQAPIVDESTQGITQAETKPIRIHSPALDVVPERKTSHECENVVSRNYVSLARSVQHIVKVR